MSATFGDWLDITSPAAALRRAATVTIAHRRPSKGRPQIEILVNANLAAALGWDGGVCVRILASPAGDALAMVPDAGGKQLRARGKALTMGHRLPWMGDDAPASAAEPVAHEIQDGALCITLPVWARRLDEQAGGAWTPRAAAASTPAPTPAAPAPTPPREAPRDKLTPEREALFRRIWLDPAKTVREVQAAVNALPGEPYSDTAMYSLAKRLGMPTQRPLPPAPPAAEEPPPAKPEPPAAAPATAPTRPEPPTSTTLQRGTSTVLDQRALDEAEAEKLIRDDSSRWHGRALAEEYGWPLDEAGNFAARIRAKIATERRDAALKAAE